MPATELVSEGKIKGYRCPEDFAYSPRRAEGTFVNHGGDALTKTLPLSPDALRSTLQPVVYSAMQEDVKPDSHALVPMKSVPDAEQRPPLSDLEQRALDMGNQWFYSVKTYLALHKDDIDVKRINQDAFARVKAALDGHPQPALDDLAGFKDARIHELVTTLGPSTIVGSFFAGIHHATQESPFPGMSVIEPFARQLPKRDASGNFHGKMRRAAREAAETAVNGHITDQDVTDALKQIRRAEVEDAFRQNLVAYHMHGMPFRAKDVHEVFIEMAYIQHGLDEQLAKSPRLLRHAARLIGRYGTHGLTMLAAYLLRKQANEASGPVQLNAPALLKLLPEPEK